MTQTSLNGYTNMTFCLSLFLLSFLFLQKLSNSNYDSVLFSTPFKSGWGSVAPLASRFYRPWLSFGFFHKAYAFTRALIKVSPKTTGNLFLHNFLILQLGNLKDQRVHMQLTQYKDWDGNLITATQTKKNR